ncbi:excalibur calcium-binding domain-containing protein [Psychrobacter sp. UBA3068]
MASCEQAKLALECGNTRLDRDKDGVPCESICPGG